VRATVRRGTKHRGWVGTLNNYTPEEKTAVQEAFEGTATHAIVAQEVGDSGTPHLQIYVEFPTQRLLSTLRRWAPRAHWEPRKGSPLQAWEYCEKDDTTPWTFGTKPPPLSQGQRNDLVRAAAIVTERGLTALAEEMPGEVRIHEIMTALERRLSHRWFP